MVRVTVLDTASDLDQVLCHVKPYRSALCLCARRLGVSLSALVLLVWLGCYGMRKCCNPSGAGRRVVGGALCVGQESPALRVPARRGRRFGLCERRVPRGRVRAVVVPRRVGREGARKVTWTPDRRPCMPDVPMVWRRAGGGVFGALVVIFLAAR